MRLLVVPLVLVQTVLHPESQTVVIVLHQIQHLFNAQRRQIVHFLETFDLRVEMRNYGAEMISFEFIPMMFAIKIVIKVEQPDIGE